MNRRKLLLVGTVFALLSILAGAFGSHALKKIFSADEILTYETAVRYQMYHAFAILFTGLLVNESNRRYSSVAGLLFLVGIIFFSGSLNLISFLKSQGIDIPMLLGLITPMGGIMFACGWIMLAASVYKTKI